MLWQPVYIEDKPYYFPLGSFAAYIDYVVTDQRGTPVRQGQLNITFKEGPEPPVVVDDCDVLRPIDEDPYDPEYNPATVLSLVKFRMLSTPQGMLFQYSSQSPTPLKMRFKVSTLYHIPGEYVSPTNIGYISQQIPINITMVGETTVVVTPPPVFATPMYLKISGEDTSAILGETVADYNDNIYIIYAVETDSTGNIYVMGETDFSYPAFVAKYSSTGEFLWQREFTQDTSPNSGDNYFYKATLDANDNIIVVGTSSYNDSILNSSYGYYVGLLVKYDPDGNELFAYTYGSVDFADVQILDVAVNADAIFISGRIDPSSKYDGFIARINPANGDIVWINQLASTANNDILMHNIEIDSAGNLLHLGKVDYGSNLMRKYNPETGAVLWTKCYASDAGYASFDFTHYTLGPDNSIYHVEADPDNTLALVLTKFDANGELVWQKKTGYQEYSSWYLGQSSVMVTDEKIYVVWCVNFNDDVAIMISDFNLDGTHDQTRYCAFAMHGASIYVEDTYASLRNGFIYLTFTELASYPDTRSDIAGVLAIPVEWNGVDELIFDNDALRVRTVIPFSAHEFTEFDIDTLPLISEIMDPFAVYSIVQSTEPAFERAPAFDYYRNSYDDASSPLALAPTAIFSSPDGFFVPSEGNFWASRQATTVFDPEQDNFIIFDPEDIASDNFENTFSIGFLERYRLYAGEGNFYKFDPYIMKHSSTGELMWMKLLEQSTGVPSYATYGLITADATGFYTMLGDGNNNVTVVKHDTTTGAAIWSKSIAFPTDNFKGSYLNVDGSTLVVSGFNDAFLGSSYIIRLNAATGTQLFGNSDNSKYNSEATGYNEHIKRISDGQGSYYNLWLVEDLNQDYGYVLSKHSDNTDAFIWQRRGRIDHTLKSNPSSNRTDIESSFAIDPSGNIYISSTLIDFKTFNGRNTGRRVLIKYDSSGTMLNHKVYRVNMENDKPTIPQNTYSCAWVDGKLISVTKNFKRSGNSVTVDAFDANLELVWSRVFHTSAYGYFPNWVKGCATDDDAFTVTFVYDADESINYVIKIPAQGDFAFQGPSGINSHQLDYVLDTQYTLVERESTHFTPLITEFTGSVATTTLTGLTYTEYTNFYENTTPI